VTSLIIGTLLIRLIKRGARYMVDVAMYKKLNPAAFSPDPQDEILEVASLKENLSRSFFLLLPSRIFGYSMQSKQWGKFNLSFISA
jgi:hypothetical protein